MIKTSQSKYSWSKELWMDWTTALSDLDNSEYSEHLNNFIEQLYLSGKEIYPIKSRLFTAFQQCSLKDVMVVVIDDSPVQDLRSSGVGRGIIESSTLIKDLPLELRHFRDCIYETIYGNQYSVINFDNSLYDLSDQNMLFLNCSMCIEENKDYTVIWKHFIRNVIQTINKRKENIIYLFLTNNHSDLYKYIDKDKNKIITNPGSVIMSYSSIFTELDEYVTNNYPPYARILW